MKKSLIVYVLSATLAAPLAATAHMNDPSQGDDSSIRDTKTAPAHPAPEEGVEGNVQHPRSETHQAPDRHAKAEKRDKKHIKRKGEKESSQVKPPHYSDDKNLDVHH